MDDQMPRSTWKEEPPNSLRNVDLPAEIALNVVETVEIGHNEPKDATTDLAIHIGI